MYLLIGRSTYIGFFDAGDIEGIL